MMIPQPQTILRQLNEILHHPDVDSITAPLHPHTITWEHHDDTLHANSIHQHPKHAPFPLVKLAKQHPPAPQTARPLEPAVKLAKQHPPAPQTACPLAPGQLAKQHPPAAQTACPPAPGRQARKTASTSTPNCMPLTPGQLEKQNSIHQHPKLHAPSTQPSSSQNSIHQHPKLHAPEHPAVKLAGQLANQQPPTRPSSSQSSIYQHPKLHAP